MSAGRAITIGAFDGVHLGHAALLAAARRAAGAGGEVVALTFEPHPLAVLRPHAPPGRLSTAEQRTRWLREAGADGVVLLEPTAELLGQPPEAFLARLRDELAPQFIVEGPDFRFGRGRAGSVETLRALEARLGYRTIVVEDVEAELVGGTLVRVASSMIRWLVRHGRVRDAARLLGRPYELVGTVVGGDGRGGSQLGMPTANLDTAGKLLIPADGIYHGTATGPDGADYPAAVSIGTKPTFGANPRVCEAHLIGFEPAADEYGWTMRLSFHDWLRDQVAFGDVRGLVDQIERDIARVRAWSRVTGERAEGSRLSHA